jgi:hypothetical protein
MNSTFFETKFTTQRLVQSGNKSDYSDHTSGIGSLRQADDTLTQLNNLQFGELWELHVDYVVDIIPTDKIIVAGEYFEVRGVKQENFRSVSYKRALLVKKKM